MTIKMLNSFNGRMAGQTYALGSTEENRLVGLGLATFDLTNPATGDNIAKFTPSGNTLVDVNGRRLGFPGIINCESSCTVLGDSLAFFGLDPSLTGSSSSNGGGSFSNSHIAWCSEFMRQSGCGIDVVSVLAQGGKDLQHIIDEQLPVALADGNAIAWVHGGINDLNASIGNSSTDTIITLATSIITQLAAAKKLVVFDSLTPVLQSGSTGAKARAFQSPVINGAIEAICSRFVNVIYNDVYSPLVNGTNANLDAASNMVRTDDGIHFLSIGGQAAGYASARTISKRVVLAKYKTRGANLLPAWTGTGGTATPASGSITGTPPVNWEVELLSGIANQAVVISAQSPNMIRFACTNTSGSNMNVFIRASNNAALLAAIATGEVLQAGFGFQVSGITGIRRLAALVGYNTNRFSYGMGQSSQEPTPTYPTIAHGGFRENMPYTVPSAAFTTWEYIIQLILSPTSGAATLDIHSPTLCKLT